jgi:hypothetical protein
MNRRNISITIVIAALVAAGAFFGGMKYAQSQRIVGAAAGRQFRNGIRPVDTQGGRPVMGEILSQDDKSMTVKLQDGSTKIIILSESTAINKATEGSKQDLTTGARVFVTGKTNSDGSVTAQNIQLNPQMRMFGSENK